MDKDISSYRSIFKSTSLFGGVQIYQILIGIIKSKIVAVLLGPMGVGILGLFTSATELIKTVTSMGIGSSAVRDVSEANSFGDEKKIRLISTVLGKVVWFTGILGMASVVVLSPLLSKVSFGNYDYTVPFMLLSVTLLIDQFFARQKILLQGLRLMKDLAKATALGATAGLIVSIPIYFVMGIKGIAPTLILTSLFNFMFGWFFARKIKFKPILLSAKQVIKESSTMLKLGIAMSLSSILSTFFMYIIRNFISYQHGVADVGLFTAGFTLMTSYTGLVFTAMSTDYFPRLAAINDNNEKCREVINQQGEIGLLILTPLLLVCIIFAPLILKVLYTNQFLSVENYIIWAASGMLFKMASWSISYVYVAKAEVRLFAIIETVSNVISLILNIIGYLLYGLDGLGMSFALGYVIYLIIVYSIARKKFLFIFMKNFKILFLKQFVILFVCVLCAVILPLTYKYIAGCTLIFICIFFSFKELNERIQLSIYLKKFKHGK